MKLFVLTLLVSFILIGCNASNDKVSNEVAQTKEVEIIVTENDLKSTKIKASTSERVATLPNQIQMGIESIIENKVTVNFENVVKKVINIKVITLEKTDKIE